MTIYVDWDVTNQFKQTNKHFDKENTKMVPNRSQIRIMFENKISASVVTAKTCLSSGLPVRKEWKIGQLSNRGKLVACNCWTWINRVYFVFETTTNACICICKYAKCDLNPYHTVFTIKQEFHRSRQILFYLWRTLRIQKKTRC